MSKEIVAAGPWMADYSRIFKNDEGEEAFCCGYSRGQNGTFTRLQLRHAPYTMFECRFIFCKEPWKITCDWYAVDVWLDEEERMRILLDASDYNKKR